MENKEHFCKDCKHFSQYYSFYKAHLLKLNKGNCHKKRADNKNSEMFINTPACKKFELKENQAESIRQQVKYCLVQIERNAEYVNRFFDEEDK